MTTDLNLNQTPVTAPVKEPKRKKIASLDRRKARAGWLFILPFLIGFVLIYLPMVKDSIVFSFSKINTATGGGSYTTEFVGWDNYKEALLVDPDFVQTLVSGLKQLAFDIPAIIIFSLFMAVMLNQNMAGRGVFRAIFFIPVILSTGIMESIAASDILSDYMEDSSGIDTGTGSSTANELVSSMDLQKLFANMKVGTEIVDYVTAAINNIYGIVNRSGVQMLIFLASLQSISPAIYESCKIDGATAWEKFWKITFPTATPTLLVSVIYTVIDGFTDYDNKVMQLLRSYYTNNNYTYSATIGVIYFFCILLIIGLIQLISKRFVVYSGN